MIEFFAAALAVIMIPAAPLNTVAVQKGLAEEQTAIVQTYDNVVTANANDVIIQTPNGTEFTAKATTETVYNDGDLENQILKYYSSYENLNGKVVSLNPKIRAHGPTSLYNSFSFAWYMCWVDNSLNCEFTDITPFLRDKSFIEVDSPQVNDIILYGNYVYVDGVEKFEYTHTGIVKEVLDEAPNGVCGNANTVLVWSKWGNDGVMEHKGDMCPFVNKYRLVDNPAFFVKYFRRHPQHIYNDSYENKGADHTASCLCGDSITEAHKCTNSYTRYDKNYHKSNCICGYSMQEKHSWKLYIDLTLSLLGLEEDFLATPLSAAPKRMLQCTKCNYIKVMNNDDEIIILPGNP